MAKANFLPAKPIVYPLPDELLVSYGDRLLWHQLGLQITGHRALMLTEREYVRTVMGFYPDASQHNVESYIGRIRTRGRLTIRLMLACTWKV